MPIYVGLINFTQKGIESIQQGPARLEAAKETYRAAGGKLLSFHLTLGRYDAIVIGELPNDEAAAKLALTVGKAGNIRTETLRAFSESEYKDIVSSLK